MERDKKEIVITGESRLTDIQEAFSACYPFLAIEFFKNEKGPLTRRNVKIEPGTPMRALADIRSAHTIDLDSLRTVSEVLHEMTGLSRCDRADKQEIRQCLECNNADGWVDIGKTETRPVNISAEL